jgi:hypothetical protein
MMKRRFKISTGFEGAEICVGTVDNKFVEHFIDLPKEDLLKFVESFEWDGPDDDTTPEPSDEFCSVYECDDIVHITAAYEDTEWYVTEVDIDSGAALEPTEEFHPKNIMETHIPIDTARQLESDHDTPVLVFISREVGNFPVWFVDVDGAFNTNRLGYSTLYVDETAVVEHVWYDGEFIKTCHDLEATEPKEHFAIAAYKERGTVS